MVICTNHLYTVTIWWCRSVISISGLGSLMIHRVWASVSVSNTHIFFKSRGVKMPKICLYFIFTPWVDFPQNTRQKYSKHRFTGQRDSCRLLVISVGMLLLGKNHPGRVGFLWLHCHCASLQLMSVWYFRFVGGGGWYLRPAAYCVSHLIIKNYPIIAVMVREQQWKCSRFFSLAESSCLAERLLNFQCRQ